jgi:hypothetical protein
LRCYASVHKDKAMQANLKIVDPTLAEVGFLRCELQVGLTLARIALDSARRGTTIRNRVNARKAYEALLRFIPKVSLTSDETKEINSNLEELKSALRQLGEKI